MQDWKSLIEKAVEDHFMENRQAKVHIKKIQEENCRTYNKKRKSTRRHEKRDLVAIKKTQFVTCRIGIHEVLHATQSSASAKGLKHEINNFSTKPAFDQLSWSKYEELDSIGFLLLQRLLHTLWLCYTISNKANLFFIDCNGEKVNRLSLTKSWMELLRFGHSPRWTTTSTVCYSKTRIELFTLTLSSIIVKICNFPLKMGFYV